MGWLRSNLISLLRTLLLAWVKRFHLRFSGIFDLFLFRMVKSSDSGSSFTLELVSADTLSTFKEFQHDQTKETYAEVEPDVEYYIQITNHSNEQCTVDVKLDKNDIEHGRRLSPGQSSRMGVWETVYGSDGTERLIERALKFKKAPCLEKSDKETTANNPTSMWTGQVTAKFHERAGTKKRAKAASAGSASLGSSPASRYCKEKVVEVEKRRNTVFTSWRPSGDVKSRIDKSVNGKDLLKKGVETERGTTQLSSCIAAPPSPPTPSRRSFSSARDALSRKEKKSSRAKKEKGIETVKARTLATVTLHYCSTVGLIHFGILPQPPGWLWAEHKYKRPISQEEQQKIQKWLKKVKVRRIEEQTEVSESCTKTLNCDEIDLTEVDSDSD